MAREPAGEGVLTRLNLLVRVCEEESLDTALGQGVRLLAGAARADHAAVFIADGNGPLREFWHSEPNNQREGIRAAFKIAALEAARTRTTVIPTPFTVGDRDIKPRALPLVVNGRVFGAVCLSGSPDGCDGGVEREREVDAVVSILAHKAHSLEEISTHREQRIRDERWFKTLDGHLRVLDRERQKFAAFVNQTDTLVFVTDESRTIRWTNRAMIDLFPPAGDEATWIGKVCGEVCTRLGTACAACPVALALEKANVVHEVLRTDTPGSSSILYLTALPIMGPSRRIDEVMVMIQDLTGLEDLRRSESRYRLVYERNIDAMVMADPVSHRIVLANAAACSMLGYSLQEILNCGLGDLHPHGEWERLRPLYSESFADESTIIPECVMRARSGHDLFAHVWATRFVLDGSEILLLNFRDITERRKGERALCESQAALHRAEEQLLQAQKVEAYGVPAGRVAHDFNNLLTVIMTQGELLLRSLPPGSPARLKAEEIKTASARGAMLMRQFLTFNRKEVPASNLLDLNAIVSEMDGMLRRMLGEDVELACVVDPLGARVRADRDQIEQVVMILVANARDAMPNGGTLRIEVSNVMLDENLSKELNTVGPGSYCSLSVTDNGCGMDAETQRRVFEPFFTTKEGGKGTGLGLSTVHDIVRQIGGSITVSSGLGKGATFTMFTPSQVATTPVAWAPTKTTAPTTGTETILLVEDEPGVRMAGRELLELSGYFVLEAGDGAEALQVAARHEGPIHLLLADVVMPVMGGSELAKKLCVVRPGMRVLFISGFTDDAAISHGALDAGVVFLEKPFTLESLYRKVREVLDMEITSEIQSPRS